jgi:hypothetical protein
MRFISNSYNSRLHRFLEVLCGVTKSGQSTQPFFARLYFKFEKIALPLSIKNDRDLSKFRCIYICLDKVETSFL